MISMTLLKQTIKSNLALFLILTAVLGLMVAMIGSAPHTNLQAAGLGFYKLIPGLIMAIYVIITANKLLASQVDKGTMAYALSTPVKRSTVVATQAAFFLGSLIIMSTVVAVSHIISSYAGGNLADGDVTRIIILNLGMFCLNAALSGICFLTSCIFNLSKYVIAVGGGIVGAFTLLNILGMMMQNFKWLSNLTISTLYNVDLIIADSVGTIWRLVVLAAIGVATYLAGSIIFTKRDLPL